MNVAIKCLRPLLQDSHIKTSQLRQHLHPIHEANVSLNSKLATAVKNSYWIEMRRLVLLSSACA